MKSANEEWKNSSMTIIKIGSDFISMAKNNSTTSMNESTKEILDNFGNILINIGKKIENLRIQLSNWYKFTYIQSYYIFEEKY